MVDEYYWYMMNIFIFIYFFNYMMNFFLLSPNYTYMALSIIVYLLFLYRQVYRCTKDTLLSSSPTQQTRGVLALERTGRKSADKCLVSQLAVICGIEACWRDRNTSVHSCRTTNNRMKLIRWIVEATSIWIIIRLFIQLISFWTQFWVS